MIIEARCSHCAAQQSVVLGDSQSIQEQLIEVRCGRCHRKGPLLYLRTVPEITVVGIHAEPPDDVSDEQLVKLRVRKGV
jgi:hypothetical protein